MNALIMLSWIGRSDLEAASGVLGVGSGPVAQALNARKYTEVALLNNWTEHEAKSYGDWLKRRTNSRISIHQSPLTSPSSFGEIYKAASGVYLLKTKQYGPDAKFDFHLSSGAPAMAAVWILMAKTVFSADMIESSKEQGVRRVVVPFDISADFTPDLYRKSDSTLNRLAAGLASDGSEFNDIFYCSDAMSKVVLKARLIALRSVSVLIEGESGTGKELIARAIHAASSRKAKPFITMNCGAIPLESFESELFGHEKGIFKEAHWKRVGAFESAHEGTIFLCEIDRLPQFMQVKLLKALQSGEIKRIGATHPRKVNTRIIAATNKNLIEEVGAGHFREDLFYRLAVAVLRVPPLRQRSGDIALLIERFLEQINKEGSTQFSYKYKRISLNAKNFLVQHPWPGNVRELQNTLMRAVAWSVGDELQEEDIRDALLPLPVSGMFNEEILNKTLEGGISLPEIMKTVAVHYLERGMAKFDGNKTLAAKILGLPSYQTLTNWLKKYGLE